MGREEESRTRKQFAFKRLYMFTCTSKKQLHSTAHYCFFCDTEAQAGESLHRASTLHLDVRVRKCALRLQDKALLLAKLSAGDMVALDAEHNIKCIVSLHNRTREAKTCTTESDVDALNHGIAFAELVSYIEEARIDDLVIPIFKLSDLSNLYSN